MATVFLNPARHETAFWRIRGDAVSYTLSSSAFEFLRWCCRGCQPDKIDLISVASGTVVDVCVTVVDGFGFVFDMGETITEVVLVLCFVAVALFVSSFFGCREDVAQIVSLL